LANLTTQISLPAIYSPLSISSPNLSYNSRSFSINSALINILILLLLLLIIIII
jgi:hypothetical protein